MSTSPDQIAALAAELTDLLGERGVTTDLRGREKASVDGARMSPILAEQLPLGLADLVAFPQNAEQIAEVVAAAVRHGVPVTPRGKGTGNYGQAIPMPDGLVLDMSKARAVVEVGDGYITAEAGTPMVVLENAARETGQQILMYPSTAQSSLGGFLSGGSGGTGSIKHGSNSNGYFVKALDVVFASPEAALVHVEGEDAQPYVHTYGTAGIIARATIALEPMQDWRGFYASFPTFEAATGVIRQIGRLEPTPRLVSADRETIVNALPDDPAIVKDRASLRAILDVATIEAATALVQGAGGRVEDVREGPQHTVRISMLSYNHPIEWLQKSDPGVYFHVEVSGDALVDRLDEVQSVYPGALLHIEAQHDRPIGMLAAPYVSAEEVYAGYDRLVELGVGYHSPHQWFVDHQPDRTRAVAATTDPEGLLNPGKLVAATAPTGAKVS
ncbi:FAD-binding oxidoreductase [Cnuibacter physcomitrellae]|uniref:FAD-binding oxidoreductase n=1 Tax=Cnuibacter physcomitrellae TaxID=1619308 RepID=UPI002175D742|nr:FAD-binding oxidoreductase [Cnuibacter physcomitrellae]MCS5496448.1 FAD-binding oxidoreductase [Cnuibacter physcomitrellae]